MAQRKGEPELNTKDIRVGSQRSKGSTRRRNITKASPKEAVLTPEALRAYKKKRAEWLQSEEQERKDAHERVRRNYESSSNMMLRIVLLVWVAIIVGIFYHIYNVIQHGGSVSRQSSRPIS